MTATTAAHTVVSNATCIYCGCDCDDIELHTDGTRIVEAKRACALGRAWYANHGIDHQQPAALIDGQPASVDDAINAAAAILQRAHLPLIYGLGNSTCEAQRQAVFLAEQVGGVIDSHTSLTHGPTKIGVQLVGKVACTLGEVKNRADFIVYWGTNPAETHPRHFTKFALSPKGKFVPRGRQGRTMVLVDVRATPSAKAADLFLQIRPGADFEALTALRALVKNQPVNADLVAATGLSLAQLQDLVAQMKRARYGVFFFGTGLTKTRGKHMNAAALLALNTDLNAFTKFSAIVMRDLGNEAGADNVFTWLTGYPFGVDLSRGYPRSNPGEFTAADLLVRQEVDAALLVSVDSWEKMPRAAIDHLERIPIIRLGPKVTPESSRGIHITTSVAGISTGGTVFRMDKVPLPMRPALQSPFPSEEEIIQRIQQRCQAPP
jgi:formylmethanofuran dehydrogenase subunit B